MFDAMSFLNTRRKANFPKCWLASTLSEKMFRKKFPPSQISRINTVETCKEIIKMLNGDYKDVEPHCRLFISSQLTFGALRIHIIQVDELEDSIHKLIMLMIPKRNKKKRTKTAIPDRLTDVGSSFRSTPSLRSLNLDLPILSDKNLLGELTPRTLGKMRVIDESNILSLPILTDAQTKLWENGEDAIWKDTHAFGQPQDSTALPVVDVDFPIPIVRPPQKRASKSTNGDAPAKKKRRSVRTNDEETVDERMNDDDPSILRTEEQDAPQNFPIGSPISTNLVDSVAAMNISEPPASIDIVESEAPIDIVEPVIPMESPIPAVPQVPPIFPVDQAADTTAAASTAAEIVQPTHKRRLRRGKKVDINHKQVSKAHRKRRQQRITLAHTVPLARTQANPAQMQMPLTLYYPSTIYLFGIENIHLGRLREYANKILYDFEDALETEFLGGGEFSGRFSEIAQPRDPAHLPIEDMSIANVDKASAVHQVTEINAEPIELVEIPQVEHAANDHPLEITDDPQLPLADIGGTFAVPFEVRNDAITESIGNLTVSNIPPERGEARRRTIVGTNGEDKDRRSSQSKSSSFGEHIKNVPNIRASTRSEKSSETVLVTKGEVESFLEILWRDNEVISFETLAPPGETSPSDATAYFLFIGDFYEEGKVDLVQDGNGSLYITKKVSRV